MDRLRARMNSILSDRPANDITPAIARAYGFGSQPVFPLERAMLQLLCRLEAQPLPMETAS
ncbi:hypothetical protein XH87_28995 [Bradyrhizobium sp. CCBAU 53415]|nr:hypothetical protein [Bradyrhizobium sp. CCBAU 53415]